MAAGVLVTPPIVTERDCAAAVKSAGKCTLIWKYEDSRVGAEPEYRMLAASHPTIAETNWVNDVKRSNRRSSLCQRAS